MVETTDKIQHIVDEFYTSFQSVVLGTITDQGTPYTSYAPFVKYKGDYYLLISKIAQHYTNLLHNPTASIMMIADESKTSNVFFRKRLSYLVHAILDVATVELKHAFEEKFGDIVQQLFTMDFIVVRLDIFSGNVIVGPGKAYQIDANEFVYKQMTGNGNKGHGSSN